MTGSYSNFDKGWTAGFGAEWAFAQNLSVKFEYLRIDLGEQTTRSNPTNPPPGFALLSPAFTTARFSTEFDVVRIGLNYRFDN
jgi:outer membrane immunogenic protein